MLSIFHEENGFKAYYVPTKEDDASLVEMEVLFHNEEELYLSRIDSQVKGQGHGTLALQMLIDWARGQGYQTLCLIPEHEGLDSWYSRMGFEGGVWKTYYLQ